MKKRSAAVGTVAFFVFAPCVVAGVVPWLLTGWNARQPLSSWLPVRIVGIGLLVAAVAVLIQSFARFVVEGGGTPAPIAPTERLVIGGLYRYVRNPMYVTVVATIVGQALVLARPVLLAYAAGVGLVVASFVRWYEEPALTRRYGDQYEAYRRAVPAWWPRSHPWTPGQAAK
jgi:protein-S-isoprenylcysteine O-methyltransferase Ste14